VLIGKLEKTKSYQKDKQIFLVSQESNHNTYHGPPKKANLGSANVIYVPPPMITISFFYKKMVTV
jgi:hypothetical protein